MIMVSFARSLGALGAVLVVVVATACTRSARNPEPEHKSTTRAQAAADPSTSAALTDRDGQVLADVAQRALPAVVSVASTRVAKPEGPEVPFDDPFFRHFFGPEGPSPFRGPGGSAPLEHGLGSGVLVAKDVILTNAHVVADAKDIVVTAGDKRVLKAKVAGTDPKSDLAVLRLSSAVEDLKPLDFADSANLKLGQIVLAIGYPFGLSGSVTMGIISAKGRANLGIADYEDFVQTDAAINPGNSGGALVDLSGRLVGVPTAILSRSGGYMGVGFAIPSNMAKSVMSDLLANGLVNRGFLGVTIQTLDHDLAQALGLARDNGVLISEVNPGSPAAKAGLKPGDVVLSVNGAAVESTGAFRNLIAGAGAKGTVDLEISRGGKLEHVHAALTAAPNEPATLAATGAPAGPEGVGIRLLPLDPAMRKRLDLPAGTTGGALVERVDPGSSADEAGVRSGDVILDVNQQPVTSGQQFADLLAKTKGSLALRVWRDGHALFLALKRRG